jgi:putative acetyltransferase
MELRRENQGDAAAIRAVHTSAFSGTGSPPVEAGLVDSLRAGGAWLPALSLVALHGGEVVGHVLCTRARVGTAPGHAALGLGPLGVLAEHQGRGVGSALMHAVLAVADAVDEPLVALLGHRDYYPRFGFRPAAEFGITPRVPDWVAHFQVRVLSSYRSDMRGEFRYAPEFDEL